MVITSEIVLSQDIKMVDNMTAMSELAWVISVPLLTKESDMAQIVLSKDQPRN